MAGFEEKSFMMQRVKFKLLTQDEFDARYPAVPEPDAGGLRFCGEVQLQDMGWLPASIHKGVPDMYFRDDSWNKFSGKVEFMKVN